MAESRRRTQRRSTASSSSTTTTSTQDKQEDDLKANYGYVFQDLRRLAIVSGIIFLLMFIVGYFI